MRVLRPLLRRTVSGCLARPANPRRAQVWRQYSGQAEHWPDDRSTSPQQPDYDGRIDGHTWPSTHSAIRAIQPAAKAA